MAELRVAMKEPRPIMQTSRRKLSSVQFLTLGDLYPLSRGGLLHRFHPEFSLEHGYLLLVISQLACVDLLPHCREGRGRSEIHASRLR